MKKIINIVIVLFPILSGYGLSLSLDFGSILLFVCGVICVIAYPREFKFKFPIGYALFFVFALFLTLVWAKSVPSRLLLFSINLLFACQFADWKLLWKYYGKVVWGSAAFFLIQEMFYYAIGSRPSGILPFIPTIYGGDDEIRIALYTIADRSSSLFLEPSYFAQFLIPFVAISLFSTKDKAFKKAIFVSVIIVLVRSGIGIMLLVIVWLLWFLFSNVKTSSKILASVVAVLLLGVMTFSESGVMTYFTSRSGELLSFTGEEQYQSSGFVRFFRGYYAFADVPTINKLFGSSPEVVEKMLLKNEYFLSESDQFLNGMQSLLFYQGIVGAFFYLRHILLFPIKTGNKVLIVIAVSFVFMLLGESYYLCSRSFLLTVFMYLIKKENVAGQLSTKRIAVFKK